MECVVSIGVSILGKIGEYAVAPVGRQLGYLVCYNRNVTNLKTEIQQLRNAKNRLEHAVEEATRDAEGIEDDVQEWLCKAGDTINEAEGFIQTQGESNLGHCNVILRYQLSRKTSKMAGEIHHLKEDQVTRLNKVSYRLTLQSDFKNKLYREFESRMETLNNIMGKLRDPMVSMVVMYGPGGIGKTMLAEEVARRSLGEKLFSNVIMVSISHVVDVEKVQKGIAEKLGLKLTEQSLSNRAERIQHRLEQEKEILLILDDVWVQFNLADVGISFRDDQKGCKILVTSRFQHLLFDDHMDAVARFEVGFLSDAEATTLFNNIVGKSVEQPAFKILAPQIIRECARLPIAIATVARALRDKDLAVWNDALRQLRSSIMTGIQGMEARVYKSIKLSYDFLRSEEARLLFFLCCLRQEDAPASTEMLLRYTYGLGIFQHLRKWEEIRDRVYTLVGELKAYFLVLHQIDWEYHVRVHDMIRDFGLSTASREWKMHRVTYPRQLELLNSNNALKESFVIFLNYEEDDQLLPKRISCPNLKFLFLDNVSVPDQFLEEINNLRVLEFNRVPLERFPSSICALQSLVSLVMWGCLQIRDIAIIGELKSLELLTIADSGLLKVPKEIGQLIRLRLLDFDDCFNLKIIESNVLSKLTKLEELTLRGVWIEWEYEGIGDENSSASLTEVKDLALLTALHLQIYDANVLPHNFVSEKWERYKILIGHGLDDKDFQKYKLGAKKILELCISKSELVKEKGLGILLKKSEVVYLEGLEGVNNFAYEVDAEGFQHMKCLALQNSNEIQHMVNSMEQPHPCSAFQSLEFLSLRSMMKLEKICHGELTPESFTSLKVIQVSSCHKLRNLFHYSIAKCTLQLEVIKVIDCEMIEEIVINESQVVSTEIIFPHLRTLELKNVPKLSHYISELEPPQRSPPHIFCGKLADPTSFLKLRELVVEGSDSIKCLFSSSIAKNLEQLNRLEIRKCSMLEEIIVMDRRTDKLSFPLLNYMMLENLPRLKRFCSEAVLDFPLLAEIKMKGCPELVDFRLHIRAQTSQLTKNRNK